MSNTLKRRVLLVVCIASLVIIVAGIIIISLRRPHSRPVEFVTPAPAVISTGSIIIDGAIGNPGIYPAKTGDTLDTLLLAAGGTLAESDVNGIRLYVPWQSGNSGEQKVDLNRAGSWLLEALPGIGETLASRIIEYREKNGPFRTTAELTLVKGITSQVYENIKDLVTVSD